MNKLDKPLRDKQELLIRRDYEARRHGCESVSASVRVVCESALKANEVPFHSVKVRIKSAPSALEKIARKAYRRSLDKVTDLIGVRVILLYPSQINTTVALLKREFNVIEYVDKRPGVDSEQFGYSSVHLVCNFLNTERAKLPEYSSFAGMAFEIQVRTILQEVWAEIEHRLVYKSEIEAPKEIKRLVHV